MKLSVAIASDHAGYDLKEFLKKELSERGITPDDLGPYDTASVDYPDYANKVATWISAHPEGRGILVCGSGIGVSIAANRHKGIRAALCNDAISASLARKHNNANVLCLGARLIGTEVAKASLAQFLETEFEGGRHQSRVEKLDN